MFDAIRVMISRRLIESGAPSCAVGVAHKGQILWVEAFGWADRENRIAATEYTMYSVASTTKSFTATAVMILHEQGRLNVDAPVNDYMGHTKLRARVGDANAVTVRSIMSHTSGLPSYVQFFYEDEPQHCTSREQMIQRYGVVMDEPGQRFNYTNLGFGVLTYLVERVSGLAYPDFVRQNIFLPLGMYRSSIGVEPRLAPYQAKRYGPDGFPHAYYTFDHLGGSALYTSMHDLMRFGLFHLGRPLPDQKRILSEATVAEMQQTRATIGPGIFCGTCWWIRDDARGHRTVEHPGGMPGVGSDFILIPEKGLAVAAVVNGPSGALHREATKAVLELLAPDYAGMPSIVDMLAMPKQSEPLTHLLGEWAGNIHTHSGQLPFHLWVKDCGDVVAQVGDQLKTLVNSVTLSDGALKGTMLGHMPTDDAQRQRHTLSLSLRLREKTLCGSLTAASVEVGGRSHFTLPSWVEMTRV